jgi:hypothetical protein
MGWNKEWMSMKDKMGDIKRKKYKRYKKLYDVNDLKNDIIEKKM